MTDIVERLRGDNGLWVDYLPKATRDEAADEIEQLREQLAEATSEIEKLRDLWENSPSAAR